jgi:hypothetical protein
MKHEIRRKAWSTIPHGIYSRQSWCETMKQLQYGLEELLVWCYSCEASHSTRGAGRGGFYGFAYPGNAGARGVLWSMCLTSDSSRRCLFEEPCQNRLTQKIMVTEDMGTRRRYVSGGGLDDLLVTGEAGRYSESIMLLRSHLTGEDDSRLRRWRTRKRPEHRGYVASLRILLHTDPSSSMTGSNISYCDENVGIFIGYRRQRTTR